MGCGWWKSHASRGIGLIRRNLILVIHQLPLLCLSRPWHAITKTSCASKHSTLYKCSHEIFFLFQTGNCTVNIRFISPPNAQWRIESLTVSGVIGQSRNRVTDIYICSIDQTAVTVRSSRSMGMCFISWFHLHTSPGLHRLPQRPPARSVFLWSVKSSDALSYAMFCLLTKQLDNHPLTIM